MKLLKCADDFTWAMVTVSLALCLCQPVHIHYIHTLSPLSQGKLNCTPFMLTSSYSYSFMLTSSYSYSVYVNQFISSTFMIINLNNTHYINWSISTCFTYVTSLGQWISVYVALSLHNLFIFTTLIHYHRNRWRTPVIYLSVALVAL